MIKKWRDQLRSLGWSVGSGFIGAGIGLAAATLWGHTVGWR